MSETASSGATNDPSKAIFSLEGRIAIVTGGASGIGRAVARGFAFCGADVAILDRDVEAASAFARELGAATARRIAAFAVDVSDEPQVVDAIDATIRALGPIDILVNGAGHNVRKPLLEFTRHDFDGLLNVHLRGAFLTSRAVAGGMQARGRGSIINITSVLAHVGMAGVAPYAAAKGGLLQLTKALALEMAPFGVRVNAISPGFIDTPLTRQRSPDDRRRVEAATPMGRFGDPEELVGPAVFLASDASSFVTGTSLVVDGGWTAQ